LRNKTLTIIIFTTFFCLKSFGQFSFNNIEFKLKNPPKSSYKIIQTEKGKLKKILEFNNKGQIIFDYRETEIPPFFNWKEPHRFIYANEYDTSGRIIKRYDLNSNAGLTIYTYVFNNKPLTETLYTQNYSEKKKSEMNTNPYAFISKFKNFDQLQHSDIISNINSSPKIRGYVKHLNQNYKPEKVCDYSKMYKDTITTTIKYNSDDLEILKTDIAKSTNEIKRKVKTTYEKDSEVTEIVNFGGGKQISTYRFAKAINKDQNTETNFSERNGILNIRHYIFTADHYLTRVIVYETEFKENLVVPINKDFRKTAEMIYTYNEEGLLEMESMINYKTGKKDKRKYKYQIEVIN
jgi:hypothetical protein